MIEIGRFFGHTANDTRDEVNETLSYQSDLCFLVGHPKTCKTSLLFQYGYTYAQQGLTMLILDYLILVEHNHYQ
eukprot:gene9739-11374_t